MTTSTSVPPQLTETERRALDEVKRRVRALFSVREFVLFGSRARGDSRADSDIDLLIITRDALDWKETDRVIGEAFEANLAFGTLFTVHVVAQTDWDNRLWTGLALKQNIEADGIVV